jgi:uncharacterized membrane protein YccC
MVRLNFNFGNPFQSAFNKVMGIFVLGIVGLMMLVLIISMITGTNKVKRVVNKKDNFILLNR